jgi:trigger factor
VVEAAVGADRLRSEVIDDLVPPTLTQVLSEEEISPAVTPQLESLNDVDGGVDVEVRVTLWPTIELPTYKDRHIQVTSPLVTEEEMEAQVTRMLEQFATVEEVERAAEVGDFVSIDISANSGEDQVPEANAADLLYEIGSSVFIQGMDDHLAGARAGDSVEFAAPLPPGFGDRAGEPVLFKVMVNEVKERILPGLDDAWVDDNTEFETVEELYVELRERLSEAKRQAVSRQFAERALSTLVDQVEVDLPDGLIRAEMDDHMHRFLHRLQENELTLDDYFRVSGVDQESFVDDLRAQAELSLRNQLVLEALAEAEGIEVTEEDLSSTLRALAAQSGDPVAYLRAFRESGRELALASDILRNRALDVVFSNANPVDEDGNPIDLSLQVTEVEAEVVEAEPIEVEAVIAEVVEEEE